MKSMDFFAGLSWGDLSRYKIRNDQTINKEKAEALDKRIRAVLAQERTYDWANKALEFCSKEKAAATWEVLKYAQEAEQLNKIPEEARRIIQDKKDRDAKALRDAAQKADDAIAALNKAARTAQWCNEVNKLCQEAPKIPTAVRNLMKNYNLLPKLEDETVLFRKAEAMDKRIREVFKQERTYDWAGKALEFVSKERAAATQNILNYSQESGKLQEMENAAKKIIQDKLDQDAQATRDAAQKADDTIAALNKAARTAQWCNEVNKFYQEAQKLPTAVRALMRHYDLLPALENETVLFRKAEAMDKRIRDVLAQNRTYDWAGKALEYCRKERAAAARNILQYSCEFEKLQEIEDAAQKIIQDQKDRDAQAKQAAAQKADDTIAALAGATRSKYWCSEVVDFDKEVRALTREVRTLMKKLALLDQLVEEKNLFLETIKMEDNIRSLLESRNKDGAWLTKAEQYATAKANSKVLRLVKDTTLLETLKAEYWRVKYAPTVQKYKDMLDFLKKGLWVQKEVREQFHVLDSELPGTGFRMEDYIDRFAALWAEGRQKVAAEDKQAEAAEIARKQAAMIQQEKDELQAYLDCLGDISLGRASQQAVRNKFNRLNAKVGKLSFNPDVYHANFRDKWKKAALTVADAQKKDDEAAAKAKKEAEERARIAREEARRRQAKAQRKATVKSFFAFLFAVPIFLALPGVGVALTAGSSLWGVSAYLFPLGALLYLHWKEVIFSERYEFDNVLMQIVFYVATVGVSLFFDQPIVSTAISVVLVAIVFNGYPHISGWRNRWRKIICTLILAVILGAGLGYLYPHMMGLSIWNSVWLLPILSLAILFVTMVGLGKTNGEGCGILFGLLVMIHGIVYGFTLGNPVTFLVSLMFAGMLTYPGGLLVYCIADSM